MFKKDWEKWEDIVKEWVGEMVLLTGKFSINHPPVPVTNTNEATTSEDTVSNDPRINPGGLIQPHVTKGRVEAISIEAIEGNWEMATKTVYIDRGFFHPDWYFACIVPNPETPGVFSMKYRVVLGLDKLKEYAHKTVRITGVWEEPSLETKENTPIGTQVKDAPMGKVKAFNVIPTTPQTTEQARMCSEIPGYNGLNNPFE